MERITAATVIPANIPSFPRTRESRARQSTPNPIRAFELGCEGWGRMERITAAPPFPAPAPSFPRTRESRARQGTPNPIRAFELGC